MGFNDKKEQFKEFYLENYQQLHSAEKAFRNLIYLLLTNSAIISLNRIESRIKERNECINKFNLKYRKELENNNVDYKICDFITDLIGIRVITNYESDIEVAVNMLKENFEVISITDKTSQLRQKGDAFGYKGVHLDLKLLDIRATLPEYLEINKYRFEVQVRSLVQNAWSEIDHKLKYKKSLSEELKRRVISLAALFEVADREFDAIRNETKAEIEKQENIEFSTEDVLSPFSLLFILKKYFPESQFEDYKVEGFLSEILNLKPLTFGQCIQLFDQNFIFIKEYQSYREQVFNEKMNPFTITRHLLYLYNSSIFESMLFNMQRESFNNWSIGLPKAKIENQKAKDAESEDAILEFVERLSDSSIDNGWVYLGNVGKFIKTQFPNFKPKYNLQRFLIESDRFTLNEEGSGKAKAVYIRPKNSK
jgi:putative GTP pyrophosphokinase